MNKSHNRWYLFPSGRGNELFNPNFYYLSLFLIKVYSNSKNLL